MRISAPLSLAVLGLLPLFAIAQTPVAQQMASQVQLAPPQVAQTPPMGWNSWNYFAGKVTDKDIRDSADQIVSTGMRDAGYIYVNIDDTWEGERDSTGVLHSNSKFPDMKALADYVHEEQDAQLYASWGIDYLKYDLCSFIPAVMEKQAPNDKPAQMRLMVAAYDKMSKALKATGRPIVLSLCQYGWDSVWEWAPALGGNLWRTTGDIEPKWDRIYDLLEQQSGLAGYAGPGHWNDPDMLEVGNGKLSLAENRSHFSMWTMLAAPLLAGNDLPHMKPEIKAILTNRDVIAIDQDPLGHQARHVYSIGEVEVWSRELKDGAMAIAILNAGSDVYSTHPFRLNLAKLRLHGTQTAKDLWSGKVIQLTENQPLELGSHDILLVRIDAPK